MQDALGHRHHLSAFHSLPLPTRFIGVLTDPSLRRSYDSRLEESDATQSIPIRLMTKRPVHRRTTRGVRIEKEAFRWWQALPYQVPHVFQDGQIPGVVAMIKGEKIVAHCGGIYKVHIGPK